MAPGSRPAVSRRREEKEQQGEDSWGSAVNSGEAGAPSFGTFPLCCLVLWGGNVCSDVSISQAPGQSVPQHIRPRTGLKGVNRQEWRRPAGQEGLWSTSPGLLPNSWWQDYFLYCSLRMVVTVFSFPAGLFWFWFWFLALCSSCDLGRSYHFSVSTKVEQSLSHHFPSQESKDKKKSVSSLHSGGWYPTKPIQVF